MLKAWILFVVLIAAATVFLLATRWGIGTSSDSAHYIRQARHLLGREEIKVTIDAHGTSAHYPPLYPYFLALASLPGADPLVAARWLHLVLFLANISLVTWLVFRFTRSVPASAIAGALVIFSPVSLLIHTMALSEPLFVLFSFSALALLAEHLDRPGMVKLLVAAVMTALAMATRYAGAALVPVGVIALLVFGRRRMFDALVFAVFSVLPALALSLRNRLVLGTTMNRDVAFHPIGAQHLQTAAATIAGWLFPNQPLSVANVILLLLLIGAAAAAVWKMRNKSFAMLMTLYIVCFAVLLVISVSFVDFHTPLDDRILSPIYFAAIVLIACATSAARDGAKVVGIGVAVGISLFGVAMIVGRYQEGSGYATRFWRDSPVIVAVKKLPPDTWVYSNAADAVYLLTGRLLCIPIPAKSVASSLAANPEYEQQLEAMRTQLVNNGAVIAYFDRYEKRWYYPSDKELKKRLGLHRRNHFSDGDIWDYVPATTRP